jgi:hypothetical protein
VVWGFQAGGSETWLEADGLKRRQDTGVKPFWEAWGIVVGLGLVELVGHVIEADNDAAEIVHPYAIGNGEADERAITNNAQSAAEAMLTQGQIEWANEHTLHLLPVPTHQLPMSNSSELRACATGRTRRRRQLGSPRNRNGASGGNGILNWRSRPK